MPADILAKRLLGEHRWSEFLRDPEEIERNGKSSVFYCTYSSDRIVQKNGEPPISVAVSSGMAHGQSRVEACGRQRCLVQGPQRKVYRSFT